MITDLLQVKRGDERQEEGFAAGPPELSCRRLLCAAGQASEGAPSFQFFCSFQWDLRRRALSLFQQAARKTVIRCRMDRRLACLKKLCRTMKNSPLAKKVEEDRTFDLEISPDRIFPFSFPVFSALAPSNRVEVPVDPIDVTVTTHVPFFKLQVPQHYKLMGYRPVSVWEAFNSYIPTSLSRPLRTANEPVPNEAVEAWGDQQKDEAEEAVCLSFSAPEALLTPFPANPLRIFNPAPGLQAYKPTPKYLETDLEFHLCPLRRYPIPESSRCGRGTQTPNTQKKHLDRKEGLAGFMTWKDLDSITSKFLSSHPSPSSDFAHRRSVDCSTDTLPLKTPPLRGPPDDLPPLMDPPCEGVQLTTEIIRAQFLSEQALVSNSNLSKGTAARHQREIQTEATHSSQFNQMGGRVMSRLKQLEVTDAASGEH
ncbi:cilia- and flagella-associated protein 221-like [Notothenia coriiceps]|uniref:Cilia- and flagella-associated protein 221-like n=1 Tax=Notothenia coriiceps TaxID=8208 RepID=A0A6I9N1I6_9TELE|nr:PREDICTED: cilia- and flagella-associated protein 221-like [Notothenia coriiceps]